MSNQIKNIHFLGSKIRTLRKRTGLTLEDLVTRCMQIDLRSAPSISYLSLIENGKRTPSRRLLDLLAQVFQRDSSWFLDDGSQLDQVDISSDRRKADRLLLEPAALFSHNLLEISLPELLAQSRVSGRQFAHILIRAYQEEHQNRFPELERAADEISGKKFPISLAQLREACKKYGLTLKWFDRAPFTTTDDAGNEISTFFRSFFSPPSTVYLNKLLQDQNARLKYDLAYHLGHSILHGGDGIISSQATGGELGGSPKPSPVDAATMTQRDILLAWRDFECSFFAGALLCPRQPFKRYLFQKGYDIFAGKQMELTASVVMRRMTAVSPYQHWHYFDIYPPNHLRAVYRGNGIPLPWGTMTHDPDPCSQWALFQLASQGVEGATSIQISVMRNESFARLYSCIATQLEDGTGNLHTVSVGIDLMPMLESQGYDATGIAETIADRCDTLGGESQIPDEASKQIMAVSRILNINWVEEAVQQPARIICQRSSHCPRMQRCTTAKEPSGERLTWVDEIRQEIVASGE